MIKLFTPDGTLYDWLVYSNHGNIVLVIVAFSVTVYTVLFKYRLFLSTHAVYTKSGFVYDLTVQVPAETILACASAAFVAKFWGDLSGLVLAINALKYICKTQPTNAVLMTVLENQAKERSKWHNLA